MQRPADQHELIVILDFGSQYSHLIARRLRDCGVYSELRAFDSPPEQLRSEHLKGVILSGGPASVYQDGAPHVAHGVLELGVPVLGICYGFQELCHQLDGGKVVAGVKQEYGMADVRAITLPDMETRSHHADLFADLPDTFRVWMSHGDKVASLPAGFVDIGSTSNTEHAASADLERRLYGLQFHPEVTHSKYGAQIMRNFVQRVCGCACDWTMSGFVEECTAQIRDLVGDAQVIGAVSGGVDSTVAAVLLNHAIGHQFHAILVDNGLLRADEAGEVVDRLGNRCNVDIDLVDASDLFLGKLAGVTEPEKKRRLIGNTFIEVFEKEAHKFDAKFLLQGTLYPDVIESLSHKGPSATIKTHHNVGGLPERMHLKLIEPLRFLFKDEVRALGLVLGIERESVFRHPFPGPGLAIRILGEVTPERLSKLRAADQIYLEELRANDLYDQIGQAFACLLPCMAVGVMGDVRTYSEIIALRAVETTDYMTADWFDFPHDVLKRIATRIVNEVRGVNRVLYDVTSKPPGTIEFE